jgi:hypothetical protein
MKIKTIKFENNVVAIETDDNKFSFCTENHLMLLKSGRYVKAKFLKENDLLNDELENV